MFFFTTYNRVTCLIRHSYKDAFFLFYVAWRCGLMQSAESRTLCSALSGLLSVSVQCLCLEYAEHQPWRLKGTLSYGVSPIGITPRLLLSHTHYLILLYSFLTSSNSFNPSLHCVLKDHFILSVNFDCNKRMLLIS